MHCRVVARHNSATQYVTLLCRASTQNSTLENLRQFSKNPTICKFIFDPGPGSRPELRPESEIEPPTSFQILYGRHFRKIEKKKCSGYAKSPFSGPGKVLEYLGRYTHRVAISNYRIKAFYDRKVTFTWKDRFPVFWFSLTTI